MDKKELRKIMKSKRKNLSKNEQELLNNEVFLKFTNSDYYKNSKNIFIFVSYNDEVDTHRIIRKALEDKKTISVPKVISQDEGMVAIEIHSLNDLEPGSYGILEPKKHCKVVDPKTIDLAVIPGLAFDLNGGRIGYGGGFYDRFLMCVSDNCNKIALGYDFQIVKCVPMEPNDIRINGVITN